MHIKMTTSTECVDDIIVVKELKPFVRQTLKKVIDNEGFLSYTVQVKDISTNGGNYLGTLQTVTIKGNTDDGNKKLNLFLKNAVSAIAYDSKDAPIDITEAYRREGLFYTELLKRYEKIQDKYNIPLEERINAVKGYGEKNGEVIILEDVSKEGYKTYDRFDTMPLKFAELSIVELAKLHAMSFVFQKVDPKYYDENIKILNTMFRFNENTDRHLRKSIEAAIKALEGDAITRLNNLSPKIFEKNKNFLIMSEDDSVCMVHGDYRSNNILVKEIDGEAARVIPVDFQLIARGNPVTDFAFFIFLGTDQEFRRNHLEDLKELYYNTLASLLKKFDIDANYVYSRKRFEQEYKDTLDYGLTAFLMFMPFIFARLDHIPDFEKGWQDVSYDLDDRYKERVRGVVDDFIQWGYL